MRVSILGASLDVGNRGVRALGASIALLLQRSAGDLSLAFHYGAAVGGTRRITGPDGRITIEVFNCRMSPVSRVREHIATILALAALHRLGVRGPARRNPWLKTLLDADVIGDIRGGDSFSDIYGFWKFVVGSLPVMSVLLLGRSYVMLPQTYGPFRSRPSRLLAGFVLTRATLVFTRDRGCADLVTELSGRRPKFCPDVAFALEPVAPSSVKRVPEPGAEGRRTVIGLNVSGLLYIGGYNGRNMFKLRSSYRSLIIRLIDRILAETEARVLVVPHVFGAEYEQEASAAVVKVFAAKHPGRVEAINGALTERELKWIIGGCDMFVGSRMHACIAAISQCIPAVGLAYSDKFLGVFETAGAEAYAIDLRAVEPDEAIDAVLRAFGDRGQIRRVLQSLVPLAKSALARTFEEMLAAEGSAQGGLFREAPLGQIPAKP